MADTSGITAGVQSTAVFVAAARALEAQKSRPLAVDPYADVLCRAAGGDWERHGRTRAPTSSPRGRRCGDGSASASGGGERVQGSAVVATTARHTRGPFYVGGCSRLGLSVHVFALHFVKIRADW